ncbi:chromosome partitioning protein ParB [Salmonella enterica subsp. enterica serovar Infantis]|nr:chromosome partitioning protein ParB [Salmonella enterica subsp. enterica serovar Infantis]EJO1374034.1 chromosome partitioning protein ParB [Salmonella enterica]EHT8002025.1 chromosome partitioning protein ParB [Salmonella enterica subsp. enterica serovar Infantis]EHZ1072033.1 chromosome partitioning protein ParB [Salmonella enterica subsp. enterica serovar Infantis]EIZ6604356.1 chromosome partitioning protein ParB [Salmonella enterica subsp. enterica serovar Infantis]
MISLSPPTICNSAKKGDAAEHAEHHMKDNRWVPGWMCAPHPQTDATERTDNLADAA